MTANISSAGADLDTLFAPHVTSNAAATGILVNGVDISSRYDVLSAPSLSNAGARIPAVNLSGATGNLASIFCGNPSQYSLTLPTNGQQVMASAFTSPRTVSRVVTVTFASAAALTNYFYYGGRLQISATQTGGSTIADSTLATMFSNSGSLIVYDQGHYVTGSGTIYNSGTGGSNIGTTQVLLYQITPPTSYYSSIHYSVYMQANGAAGSATQITFTINLTINTSGTIADYYSGTYTSYLYQRNHPSQAVPTVAAPARTPLSITYSANTPNPVINISTLPGYVAGASDLTVTVNSGIYVYSTSTSAAMTITGGSASDTINIVNNGYIYGKGGAANGGAGGLALSAQRTVSITNNSVIGGGGGGGGSGAYIYGSGVGGTAYAAGGGGGGGQGYIAGGGGAAIGSTTGPGGINNNAAAGSGGSPTAAGPGGGGGIAYTIYNNDYYVQGGGGGAGGTLGQPGFSGGAGSVRPGITSWANITAQTAGGAAGACTSGNANITWLATGIRYGALG